MKFAVIVFPGSNCDEDAYHAAHDVLGQRAEYIWHKDSDLKGADVVILPGGFAHGDYLRTGAMARFSPVMREVQAFAERGGPVLGICNGFQVLLEAGLASRRDAAESRVEVPLRAGASSRRADRHAVHGRLPPRTGPAAADCARRGQLFRRAGRARAARVQPSGDLSIHGCRRRRRRFGEPEWIGIGDRRPLQRGAQRRRTDAASRSGPASRSSAAPTAWSFSSRWCSR